MITKIGITTGEILIFLERAKRPVSTKDLEFLIDEPREILLMALGWLIREGFVHLEKNKDEYLVERVRPKSKITAPSSQKNRIKHYLK